MALAAAGDPSDGAGGQSSEGEGGLFRSVMVSAQAAEVAFAGGSEGPGQGVVFVGVAGGSPAGREGAGAVAGFQEPLEPPRYLVRAGREVAGHHRLGGEVR